MKFIGKICVFILAGVVFVLAVDWPLTAQFIALPAWKMHVHGIISGFAALGLVRVCEWLLSGKGPK